MPVLVIGTLDTKGKEIAFVRDQLQSAGVAVTVIDAGVLGEPAIKADIPRDRVFEAAGTTLSSVREEADRGRAIEWAARGVARLVSELHQASQVEGVLGLGGSAGTTIGTAAMRALPLGIPKLMVSTLASGQVQHFVGVRDILMMPSVVDISGLNRISLAILGNAAAAMAGMVLARRAPIASNKPGERSLVAATMFGVTTPCVEMARKLLEKSSFEVLVFHATGVGGRTMESLILDGMIRGVLDLTTTELADELVGGVLSAGRDRLTAAGLRGVPQVISLGALDMVNFGPLDTVPEKFRQRRLYRHNPNVTLMRTTPEENDRLGREIAEKASAARGPTAVLIPRRGISAIDREGQPFWWPEADAALFDSIKHWLAPSVELIEMNCHINDPEFATTAADTLLRFMANVHQTNH
jgi:uncharacterized protein (UPF0261 family)